MAAFRCDIAGCRACVAYEWWSGTWILCKQHESTKHQNLYLGAGSSKPPQLLSHSCIVRGKLSGLEALSRVAKISLNWRLPRSIGSSRLKPQLHHNHN